MIILKSKHEEECSVPVFVRGSLSAYDISQINKAIEQFKLMRLLSNDKIGSLQNRLARVVMERGDCPESRAIAQRIKDESDFVRVSDAEISRYENLLVV